MAKPNFQPIKDESKLEVRFLELDYTARKDVVQCYHCGTMLPRYILLLSIFQVLVMSLIRFSIFPVMEAMPLKSSHPLMSNSLLKYNPWIWNTGSPQTPTCRARLWSSGPPSWSRASPRHWGTARQCDSPPPGAAPPGPPLELQTKVREDFTILVERAYYHIHIYDTMINRR